MKKKGEDKEGRDLLDWLRLTLALVKGQDVSPVLTSATQSQ